MRLAMQSTGHEICRERKFRRQKMHTAKLLIGVWLLASGFEPLWGGMVALEWYPLESLRSVLWLMLPFLFLGIVVNFSETVAARSVAWICLVPWSLWFFAFTSFGGADNLMASRDPRLTLLKESKEDSTSFLRTYYLVTDSLSADVTLVRFERTLLPGVKWVRTVGWSPNR
jgi:hypothetical protein